MITLRDTGLRDGASPVAMPADLRRPFAPHGPAVDDPVVAAPTEFRRSRLQPGHAGIVAIVFATAALFAVPLGMEAELLRASEDDPVAISEMGLARSFDRPLAEREIEAALAAKDSDLAKSFVDLAGDRGIVLPPALIDRVAVAVARDNSTGAKVETFARGFISGEPDDVVGLAGTALGDLFVFGDIRDAVREGSRFAKGEAVDELVLGLSVVGLAVTAGTYASFGAGGPARVGLSAVKAARKTSRLGAGLADWIGRSVREVVDWPALRKAGGSIADPAAAVRAARAAVKTEKAGGLMKLAGDIGQVQAKAGTRGAFDALKLASGPADVAKVAEVAGKHGTRTRAVLKTLGKGAILLSVASFNLAMWIMSALFTLFGLVTAMKSGVERLTQRAIDRGKVKRAERFAAMAASTATARA